MSNSYLDIPQNGWQTVLARYFKLLLRWGWFVALSIAVATVCSRLIPDSPAPDAFQATLQVQVQSGSVSAAFFSQLFTSPNTLNLLLLLPKYRGLQLSDIEGLVSATPVTGTNVVLLNALGGTAHDASSLASDLYQTLLQEVHSGRAQLTAELNTALRNELKRCEVDIANAQEQLQSLSQTNRATTSQYRQIDAFYQDKLKRADTINNLLTTLQQEGFGRRGLLALGSDTPVITTVTGAQPTQGQRVALSPLIGLIMGLGGIFLASSFSGRLPQSEKRRREIVPRFTAIIPVLPNLRRDRLQVLSQASSSYLPLVGHLRYQADAQGKRLKLITVTSSMGGEGKSTAAVGLAFAAAKSDLRVLLIDANASRPSLHIWFKLSNAYGTVDYIRTLGEGIDTSPMISTVTPGLGVLTIGNTEPRAPFYPLEELLRVDGLNPLSERLLQMADLIIFDAPSLLSDACAVSLVGISDVTLLVIDEQKSKNTMVVEAEDLLSKMGAFRVTVLNRARVRL